MKFYNGLLCYRGRDLRKRESGGNQWEAVLMKATIIEQSKVPSVKSWRRRIIDYFLRTGYLNRFHGDVRGRWSGYGGVSGIGWNRGARGCPRRWPDCRYDGCYVMRTGCLMQRVANLAFSCVCWWGDRSAHFTPPDFPRLVRHDLSHYVVLIILQIKKQIWERDYDDRT